MIIPRWPIRLGLPSWAKSKAMPEASNESSTSTSSKPSDGSTPPWSSSADQWLEQKTEKVQLGLGSLQALGIQASNDNKRRLNRAYDAGQFEIWKARARKFGLVGDPEQAMSDEMQTVRIDSADNHYHYPARPGLLGDLAKLAIAAALGAGGLAAWSWYNADKPPTQVKPVLDPGGLKIDVERPVK
jgi:hypothetical protein